MQLAHPELNDLNDIRLSDDLTYGDLAAGIGVDRVTLQRLLQAAVEPRDRTLHKVKVFLPVYKEERTTKKPDAALKAARKRVRRSSGR
jgi:predicted transcriptional regulator